MHSTVEQGHLRQLPPKAARAHTTSPTCAPRAPAAPAPAAAAAAAASLRSAVCSSPSRVTTWGGSATTGGRWLVSKLSSAAPELTAAAIRLGLHSGTGCRQAGVRQQPACCERVVGLLLLCTLNPVHLHIPPP